MYKVGQYFELSPHYEGGTKEIYLLAATGEEVILVDTKTGNRWCDGHGVCSGFRIGPEEFKRIASNQPERFTPVDVQIIAKPRQPEWEV